MKPVKPVPLLRLTACALSLAALAGCASTQGDSTFGYYWQSFRGHMALMNAARPVDDWITDPSTQPALRARLELARSARAFAVQELALPDNASYHRYAQLGRNAAVWNVVAAPTDSLQLHTWCFPVTGCIGYRGYFAEDDARAEAARLAATGLETSVYPVPAYSTLGYSNWMGGDPLLNTFVSWPEGDFVRLLFHELAHQVAYASGDTSFNESYATAVERLGVAQWLRERSTPQAQQEFAASEQRRKDFRALTLRTRTELQAVYEARGDDMPERKHAVMQTFFQRYADLKAQWITAGMRPEQLTNLDRWVREANNASFGAQAAYDDLVPAFTALYEKEGRNWPRFHAEVIKLSKAPRDERHAVLEALTGTQTAAKTKEEVRPQN